MNTRFTALNTSILLGALSLEDQLRAARDHQFTEVELWWPFVDAAPTTRAQDEMLRTVEDSGLSLISLNLYEGGMAQGERGLVCRADTQGVLDLCVPIARRLLEATGCRHLNVLHGNHSPQEDEASQRARAAQRTAAIADDVASLGVTVLIEQLSNVAAYGVQTVPQLLAAVADARALATAGSVKIQYDVYHLWRVEADLRGLLESHVSDIGHIQLADLPERGGPGTGILPWDDILATIERLDYPGRIALEYSHYVNDPFEWMEQWQARS